MLIWSSQEESLDLEQINELNGHVDEFLAADYKLREKIVRNLARSFHANSSEGCPPEDDDFDWGGVQTVCTPSAALGFV